MARPRLLKAAYFIWTIPMAFGYWIVTSGELPFLRWDGTYVAGTGIYGPRHYTFCRYAGPDLRQVIRFVHRRPVGGECPVIIFVQQARGVGGGF